MLMFFLQPLEMDKVGYFLVEEMYTDSFVDEIKRRCKLSGDKYPYRGLRLEDFTKEWRINQLNGIKDERDILCLNNFFKKRATQTNYI